MNKKISGLLLFFSPEFVLLAIWILCKSSIVNICAIMLSDTAETGSIRLVVISGVLLSIVQVFRIGAFQSNEGVGWRCGGINIPAFIVMVFIILGIFFEFQSAENLMVESYASVVMFFATMTGAIYLFVEIFMSLTSLVAFIIKRG